MVAGDRNRQIGFDFGQFVERLFDVVGHGDGVAAALLADADHNRVFTVETRDRVFFLKPVDYLGHIAQIDGCGPVADDHVPDIVDRLQVRRGPYQEFGIAVLDRPARQIDVGGLQRGGHLLRRNAARLQRARVQIDLDLAHLPTGNVHRRDVGDTLQRRLDVVFRQLAQVQQRKLSGAVRYTKRQNRQTVGVEGTDDRVLHVGGQLIP